MIFVIVNTEVHDFGIKITSKVRVRRPFLFNLRIFKQNYVHVQNYWTLSSIFDLIFPEKNCEFLNWNKLKIY